MTETLEQRIETLERAVTDGDHDLSGLAAEADAVDRLETLETRVDDIDDRVSELEAATQALRGYVGNIRSVNTDVEQQAEIALAKVESLEATLDLEEGVVTGEPSTRSPVAGGAPVDPVGGEGGNASEGHHPDSSAGEEPSNHATECASCGRPRPAGSASDRGLTDGGRDRSDDASESSDARESSDASEPTNHTRVYHTGTDGQDADVFPDAPDRAGSDESTAGTLQRIRNML